MKDKFVKEICKPGTAECCRYLLMGGNGWECAKLQPQTKAHLDDRVARNDMRATGDNCDGINT